MTLTRRRLIQTSAAASLASLLPRAVFSQGVGNRKAVVHADQEIGVIRPELHSHFAEHLGSCVYGGIWVGKNSPVHDPDINAYNSFDNPNRVVIRPHPVAVENGRIRVTLPAMSVATVTLQVA